jgi:hypothetical protein
MVEVVVEVELMDTEPLDLQIYPSPLVLVVVMAW